MYYHKIYETKYTLVLQERESLRLNPYLLKITRSFGSLNLTDFFSSRRKLYLFPGSHSNDNLLSTIWSHYPHAFIHQ